jgi:fluoride ion exporter CrcB/FEX
MRLIILDGLRHHASRWVLVLVVNVVGSALAGAVLAFPVTGLTAIVVVGLAGGLTTFSTVALLLVPSRQGPRVPALLGQALAQSGAAVTAAWGAFQIVQFVT